MAENFQNFYVTKLREACDASATTIYVDTPPNFSEGTLVLEFSSSTKHEIIHFTGKSGYGLTGCTRGHEGTTAQSHSAGVDVRQNVTAGILDKIINRAITTENIADNAVTTAKINNGAVTADKIDFTTITGQPNAMPIAEKQNVNLGYGASVRLQRVGNIVIAATTSIAFNISTVNNVVKLDGVIFPSGFRPVVYGNIFSQTQDKNATQHEISWTVYQDGSVYISNLRAGNGRDTLLGIWITNDPWPTN